MKTKLSRLMAISIMLLLCLSACGAVKENNTNAKPQTEPNEQLNIETPAPTKQVETQAPEPTEEPVIEVTDIKPKKQNVTSFTFTASGDNLIHSTIYNQAKTRGKNRYDFSYCYKFVKKFFKKKDLNWINQETLVNDAFAPSGYPAFSTPTDVIKDLVKCNFKIFNTSSNHSYDKGIKGLKASMSFWNKMKKNDAYQVGITTRDKSLPELIYNIKDIKVGFLSYTYGTNGITIANDSKYRVVYLNEKDLIKKQVTDLRKKVDVVIISCHWGVENSHTISNSQKKMAKNLTKWGADLIIGTHPHVLQDCAWIKTNKRTAFCAYSLGNFISTQTSIDQLLGGTLTCKIKVDKDNKKVTIQNPKIKPTVTTKNVVHVNWLSDFSKKSSTRKINEKLARKIISKQFLTI